MKKLCVCLLGILLLLTSCSVASDETRQIVEFGGTAAGRDHAVELAEEQCPTVIEALFAGDSDTFSRLCNIEKNRNFYEYFRVLSKYLGTSKSYSLKTLEVRGVTEDGFEEYIVTLRMTCSNGNMFRLEAYCSDASLCLEYLEFHPMWLMEASNQVPAVWHWLRWSFYLLCIGFSIWMLVDICRQSMSYLQKVLCFAVCLLTVGFSLSWYPGSVSVLPLCGWILSVGECSYIGNMLTLELYFPVGAILYILFRGKLRMAYLRKRMLYYEARDARQKAKNKTKDLAE